MADLVGRYSRTVVDGLERLGVIGAEQLRETFDLAWPRIVTGLAVRSKQLVDLALVGIAVGSTGTAGLAFAYAYWEVAVYLGIGLAGGTVSLVSQNFGGDETKRASLVVKQSALLALAITLPIVLGFVFFAEELIGLMGGDPASVGHGSVYLKIAAVGIPFEFLNLVASRTYAGVSDTFTPMVARAGGAVCNIGLSAVFIFGAGLGAAGAALGTTIATAAVTVVLAWGLLGRRYGVLGMDESPVRISARSRWWAPDLSRQLVEVSLPLMGRRVAEGLLAFPLLWIAATFGPAIVAAIEVGRRIRALINTVQWGLGTASSTLVGQRLGAGDEDTAEAYGTGIIRLTVLVYLCIVAFVVALAPIIASVFVDGPAEVAHAAGFVVVGAVSAIGLGVDGASTGALRGAGDTRWPFVASLIGRYGFALPVAGLGTVTALGMLGLHLALVLETFVPAAVTYWLFRTGQWKVISRRYRPSAQRDELE